MAVLLFSICLWSKSVLTMSNKASSWNDRLMCVMYGYFLLSLISLKLLCYSYILQDYQIYSKENIAMERIINMLNPLYVSMLSWQNITLLSLSQQRQPSQIIWCTDPIFTRADIINIGNHIPDTNDIRKYNTVEHYYLIFSYSRTTCAPYFVSSLLILAEMMGHPHWKHLNKTVTMIMNSCGITPEALTKR